MSDRLRAGVVGLGGQGRLHLRTIAALPDYELTAVADTDEAAVRELATGNVEGFTEPEKLIASGLCDVVAIAVPPWFNPALVTAALDAGLHVYVEKPLAPTIGQARSIAALARRRDRRVQVGFHWRFQPAVQQAAQIAHSGELGAINRVDVFAGCWFRTNAYFGSGPWRGRWSRAGGGVLMIQAVHDIDAALWLAGSPSAVTARARRWLHDVEVEDDVNAVWEFPGGARGVLIASTIDVAGAAGIWIHGDEGILFVDGSTLRRGRFPKGSQRGAMRQSDQVYMSFPVQWEDVDVGRDDPFTAAHRNLIEAVRTGRDPRTPPEEACRSLELANAVYLSELEERRVDLPLDPDAYERVYERLCAGELSLSRA